MNILKNTKLIIAAIFAFIGLSLAAQTIAPQPVSGKNATKDYIQENLIYPTADLEQDNSGKVVVAMHIDKEGKASQFAVKSTFSEAAAPIAMHLAKTILWLPATHNGIAIESDHDYTIDFSAKSYKRYWKRHERYGFEAAMEADSSYVIYENQQLEESPRFNSASETNLTQYIYNNMKYPTEAKEREIQGTVRIEFVIETNGNVSNINIINSVGGGCDNEAIRLIKETHWIPGTKNGKYVRCHSMQDITFSIGNRNFQDGNSY